MKRLQYSSRGLSTGTIMYSTISRLVCRIFGFAVLTAVSFLLIAPAFGAVELRVEGRPSTGPIEAYVKVTDVNGDPVPLLDENDFTILIDGQAITIAADDITLPPALDPNQRLSVMFVMDYSVSVVSRFRADMENAVVAFIGQMVVGDHAAVVKFNATNPNAASVVVPFTEVDHGANDATIISGVQSDYDGNGTNMAD